MSESSAPLCWSLLSGGPGGLECGGAAVGRTDGRADRRRLINIGTATKIESSTSHVISTLLPYLSVALLSSPVLCTSRRVGGTVEREEEEEAPGELLLAFVFCFLNLCFWLTFGIQRQWRSSIGEFSLIGLQSIYYESRKFETSLHIFLAKPA